MENKFNQWMEQVDGKVIEAEDASNYAQCFDLAFNWCDFLEIPRDTIRHLYAYQIFTNPNSDTSQYWNMIVNTLTGIPQIGDLVIWGTIVGPAGHVAIFKEGDTLSFRSEDQNWAGLQKAKLINHTYNGVLGWLHPKVNSNSLPINIITDQTIISTILDENGNPMEIQQIRSKLADQRQTIKDQANIIVNLKNASNSASDPKFRNLLAKLFYSMAQALG